jgi:hypothetical protein
LKLIALMILKLIALMMPSPNSGWLPIAMNKRKGSLLIYLLPNGRQSRR